MTKILGEMTTAALSTLRKAQQEVATKRSKLQKPKSEPAEKAARRELRDYMRSLNNAERDAFLVVVASTFGFQIYEIET